MSTQAIRYRQKQKVAWLTCGLAPMGLLLALVSYFALPPGMALSSLLLQCSLFVTASSPFGSFFGFVLTADATTKRQKVASWTLFVLNTCLCCLAIAGWVFIVRAAHFAAGPTGT